MKEAAAHPVKLTESLEDYLEAIAELTAVEGHAHTKAIAERLNVKMPSVTGALRQLVKLKYIVYSTHFPVELTPEGKAVADEVIRRHRILKRFFSDVLGVPIATAEDAACHVEHIVDAETIRRFVIFSEAIEKRSDARRLQGYLSEAMGLLNDPEAADWRVLTDFQPGARVVVRRLGRNLPPSADCGVAVGETVLIDGITLDRSAMRLHIGGAMKEIPLEFAENIWAASMA